MRAFLRRHARIALDTSIFIYQIEANPRYITLAHEVFLWIERSGHTAATSTITMTELLVKPYRDLRSDDSYEEQVNAFYGLLTAYPNLDWIAPDLQIADLAARLRAQYGLRTPDAIQASTAIRCDASGFVANDAAFRRVPAFETLLFEELL